MDITTIKNKRPWFVPKWLWNQIANSACDSAKAGMKIDTVGEFVGNAAMDGLSKAIEGKDASAIEKICTTIENSSNIFAKASSAAKDGVVTDKEKKEVGDAISAMISALIPQSAIDDKIEEIRSNLIYE